MNLQTSNTKHLVRQDVKRPPLERVRCLLPLWGYEYVRKFLEVALPTWLADGNLPAVSRMYPTEFVFLSGREDEIYLRAHPAFQRLCAICSTTVHFVDHFITGNN